jgi:arginyl-tRNA synthetase
MMENKILDFLAQHFDTETLAKVNFSPVPRGQAGDLAMNFFQLSKSEKKSPVELAENFRGILADCDLLEKTEIAGPYLNLYFSNEFFYNEVFNTPLKSEILAKKSIVFEFSGPNTNKPLHLGHMRNHALGISMSNLLESCGATVHRVNIINDRGVHICKSMLAYQLWGNGETPESREKKSDHFVGDWYVKFSQEVKNNPDLEKKAQEMLVKWEAGDKEIMELWKRMSEWAVAGHRETYARQGIYFEKDYKESEYYLKGKELAEKGLAESAFERRDDGAIVVSLSEDLKPKNAKNDESIDTRKVVLRADGTSIYLTQDLAIAEARKKDFNPNQLVYVVADEQNYHFKVLFYCLEKLNLAKKEECLHLGYGLVHLPDGRMKSREGNVVDADNLMDDLFNLAKTEVSKRNEDLSENAKNETSEKIMDAAWKFYLLSTNPRKSITFDVEKSIAFEGATGPYLQYAGVRIKSILRKSKLLPLLAGEGGGEVALNEESPIFLLKGGLGNPAKFLGEAEKNLGVKILEFSKVLEKAVTNSNPTYLVTFLMELAQDWSSFYANNSVLNADNEDLKNSRVLLAHKVLQVLEKGTSILGFGIPEVM